MIFNEDGSITFDQYDNQKLHSVWSLVYTLAELIDENPAIAYYLDNKGITSLDYVKGILGYTHTLHKHVADVVVGSFYSRKKFHTHVTENNWKPKEEKEK